MTRRGTQFLDCERLGSAWTDTDLVFTTMSGLPVEPRNLNRSFARICNTAGIRLIRVHDLRHTTATLLKALKVPPKDAQVILGHAHVSTTNQIYTHVDEAAKRDALGKLTSCSAVMTSDPAVVSNGGQCRFGGDPGRCSPWWS